MSEPATAMVIASGWILYYHEGPESERPRCPICELKVADGDRVRADRTRPDAEGVPQLVHQRCVWNPRHQLRMIEC